MTFFVVVVNIWSDAEISSEGKEPFADISKFLKHIKKIFKRRKTLNCQSLIKIKKEKRNNIQI